MLLNKNEVLLKIYEENMREYFKFHPNADYLINQMKRGELNQDEVATAIEAADGYRAHAMAETEAA